MNLGCSTYLARFMSVYIILHYYQLITRHKVSQTGNWKTMFDFIWKLATSLLYNYKDRYCLYKI